MPGKSVLDEVHCWKGFGVYKGAIAQSQESLMMFSVVLCKVSPHWQTAAAAVEWKKSGLHSLSHSLTHLLTHSYVLFQQPSHEEEADIVLQEEESCPQTESKWPNCCYLFFLFFFPCWHFIINIMAPWPSSQSNGLFANRKLEANVLVFFKSRPVTPQLSLTMKVQTTAALWEAGCAHQLHVHIALQIKTDVFKVQEIPPSSFLEFRCLLKAIVLA